MPKVFKLQDTQNNAEQVASFYRTEDNKFFWVSAVNNKFVHETMVFESGSASDDEIDFAGLVCLPSVFDHAEALAVLGYEIA
jgi:hypothetical protein